MSPTFGLNEIGTINSQQTHTHNFPNLRTFIHDLIKATKGGCHPPRRYDTEAERRPSQLDVMLSVETR